MEDKTLLVLQHLNLCACLVSHKYSLYYFILLVFLLCFVLFFSLNHQKGWHLRIAKISVVLLKTHHIASHHITSHQRLKLMKTSWYFRKLSDAHVCGKGKTTFIQM